MCVDVGVLVCVDVGVLVCADVGVLVCVDVGVLVCVDVGVSLCAGRCLALCLIDKKTKAFLSVKCHNLISESDSRQCYYCCHCYSYV